MSQKQDKGTQSCNPMVRPVGCKHRYSSPTTAPPLRCGTAPEGRGAVGFWGEVPADTLCASCRARCHRGRTLQSRAPLLPAPARLPRPRRRTTARRIPCARSAGTSAPRAPARAGTASASCACGTGAWARPRAHGASGPRATPTPSTCPCTTRCRTGCTTTSGDGAATPHGSHGAAPDTWDTAGPGRGGEGDP